MATESELVEVKECANFLEGLRYWAYQKDPVTFNSWQEAVSQIRKLFTSDPDLPVTGPDYTQRMASLWRETMVEIHGPDWKRGLFLTSVKARGTRTGSKGPQPARSAQGALGASIGAGVSPSLCRQQEMKKKL